MTMTDISAVKKIISSSFLPKAEKAELLEYLEKKGAGIVFFGMFNDYLKNAIIKEGLGLTATIKEIDKLEERLEDRITGEKIRIEENMEQELGALGSGDKDTKDRIWDEYYDNLEKLGASYERGVKEILSKIATKI